MERVLVMKNDDSILSQSEFANLKSYISKMAGIELHDSKKLQLSNWLKSRLEALQFTSFKEYEAFLTKDEGEFRKLINNISNLWTYFFRESYQFDYLAKKILPELLKKHHKIRIWSAGCSTGEEAYSIAMIILDVIEQQFRSQDYDIKILATDINEEALEVAKRGVYEIEKIKKLGHLKKWFTPIDKTSQYVKVDDKIKALISFLHLNLLSLWPMKRTFDIIFCRNVTIYFSLPARKELMEKLDQYVNLDGLLIIGFPENLESINDRYRLLDHKIYRKIRKQSVKTEPLEKILIVIGASTGGVEAIESILESLPEHFPPILITQHIRSEILAAFAKSLNKHSKLSIKEAEENEEILPGTVLIAPGKNHLTVKQRNGKLFCHLDQSPPVNGHKPSIDRMFQSAANLQNIHVIGVLLTGIGEDGAEGAKAIHDNGYYVIVQNKATSIAFNMPKAAIDLNAVHEILSLKKIPEALFKKIKQWGQG